MAALLGLGARRIFSNSFRLSLRPFSVGWMRNVFTPSRTLELNRFLPNTLGLRQLSDNVSTSESDAVFENDTAEQPDHSLISRRPPRRRQEEPKSFSRFSYERTMRKLGSVSSKETLRKHFEHMLREGMSELTSIHTSYMPHGTTGNPYSVCVLSASCGITASSHKQMYGRKSTLTVSR